MLARDNLLLLDEPTNHLDIGSREALEEALAGKDVIVLAVPSVAVRSTARKMNPYIRYGQLIVNVAKGIEEHTLTTLTDMIEEEIPNSQACVLSGPATRRKSAGICYDLRGGGKKKRNCGISAEYLYESRVPRVYQRMMLGIERGRRP